MFVLILELYNWVIHIWFNLLNFPSVYQLLWQELYSNCWFYHYSYLSIFIEYKRKGDTDEVNIDGPYIYWRYVLKFLKSVFLLKLFVREFKGVTEWGSNLRPSSEYSCHCSTTELPQYVTNLCIFYLWRVLKKEVPISMDVTGFICGGVVKNICILLTKKNIFLLHLQGVCNCLISTYNWK